MSDNARVGRPRVYDERTARQVRLPPTLWAQLDEWARQRDVSRNLAVERACERMLEAAHGPDGEPWDWGGRQRPGR